MDTFQRSKNLREVVAQINTIRIIKMNNPTNRIILCSSRFFNNQIARTKFLLCNFFSINLTLHNILKRKLSCVCKISCSKNPYTIA